MPNILITGGTGFIGRHLVQHLLNVDSSIHIRVADKVIPALAYLNDSHRQALEKVEFVQCDLSKEDHVANRAFKDLKFDFVVNLAAETSYGKSESIYKQHVVQVAKLVATQATLQGAKYVEVSTAQIYKSGKKPRNESCPKIKPWTLIAKSKWEVEEMLRNDETFQSLEWIILRPAIVYGVGDTTGLTPRVVTAATYAYTKQKMQFLWSGDMKINCVHVSDVARAIWHVLQVGQRGQVFNLADRSNLTQKKFNTILSEIFKIKTGFVGSLLSKLASTKLNDLVNQANENHMEPWNDMKKDSKIRNSPLSPYIDIELLSNNWLSVDGTLIESTGFKYEKPQIKTEYIREMIDSFKELKLFPEV